MSRVRLDYVDWPEALAQARDNPRPGVSRGGLFSLSALYAADLTSGLEAISAAVRFEPLHPIHRLRRALLHERFGDVAGASAVLDSLRKDLPEAAGIGYLRALTALRGGTLDKARSMTGSLESAHPAMVQAKFLRAETLAISNKAAATERHLMSMPTGPEWDACWADLLVKLTLLHRQDGPALVRKYLKKVTPGSPARTLVDRALVWAGSSVEELAALAAAERSGSRSEEILIECVFDRLNTEETMAALNVLRGLGWHNVQRRGMQRVYDAFLMRRAGELVSGKDYQAALRLVEQSLSRNPYDLVYHQNRAALFTLMREQAPYREAWAVLNAHEYRLALLGVWDAASTAHILKMHLLFAQQARGAGKNGAGGIFRVRQGEDGEKPWLLADSELMAQDPDLLRQWMHHTRAILVFEHVQLRSDSESVFLHPADRDEANARAEALAFLGGSLQVLVPEEGAELSTLLELRWKALAARIATRYTARGIRTDAAAGEGEKAAQDDAAPKPDDLSAEEHRLQERHLLTLADLCLLCLQWRPEYSQLYVAEEILHFADAEVAFFDDRALIRMEDAAGLEVPYPIRLLQARSRAAAGGAKGDLTPEQKKQAVDGCKGELLRTMAWVVYQNTGGNNKERAERALLYVDRALQISPKDPDIQLTAARILAVGEFWEDGRLALERYRKLGSSDRESDREQAAELAKLFEERRKEGKSTERRAKTDAIDDLASERDERIRELEEALDRAPSAWQSHKNLVRELAAAGRFAEAVHCADRAVARCLGRAEQIGARSLAIETRGIEQLARDNAQAARLLAVGAHEPARRALEAQAQHTAFNYVQLYVLGQCQLAAGLPEQAQASFQKAAELCDRPMHRTVLQILAGDIDSAYMAMARNGVDEALADGRLDGALDLAGAAFAHLRKPEAWMLDYTRASLGVALQRGGAQASASPAPVVFVAPWYAAFRAAMSALADGERAFALAQLTAEVHPASARQAQILADRAKAFNRRLATAAVLARAGALLAEKRFAETLTLLDGGDEAMRMEPRLQRLRALALMGLRRLEEADEVVAQLKDSPLPEIREFNAQYPALAFRQRLATALELLRQGKTEEAAPLLHNATAPDAKGADDLAYCRAFLAALEGYELRRKGRREAAQDRFLEGLRYVVSQLQPGAGADRKHVADLYERLEKEVDSYAHR